MEDVLKFVLCWFILFCMFSISTYITDVSWKNKVASGKKIEIESAEYLCQKADLVVR